jgi:hypothetical protein
MEASHFRMIGSPRCTVVDIDTVSSSSSFFDTGIERLCTASAHRCGLISAKPTFVSSIGGDSGLEASDQLRSSRAQVRLVREPLRTPTAALVPTLVELVKIGGIRQSRDRLVVLVSVCSGSRQSVQGWCGWPVVASDRLEGAIDEIRQGRPAITVAQNGDLGRSENTVAQISRAQKTMVPRV